MSVIGRAWKDYRWLSLGIGICLMLIVVIVLRLALHWAYWQSHKEVSVRPWMTIGYVARSYGFPKNTIFEIFRNEFELERGKPETISQIAKRQGKTEEEIIESLLGTIGRDEGDQQ